jgi:lipoyl(octanoyl) transferase
MPASGERFPPMSLHVLPVRTAGAAENMAVDFLLLSRYPEPAVPRFRHYEWRAPAATFGYSQKIEFVRANLPPGDDRFDLCRRATGGGIVDHRTDWTYALVIPRSHPLYDEPAPRSYRAVHEGLAAVLVALGQPAVMKMACDPAATCGSELARDKSTPSRASALPPTGPTLPCDLSFIASATQEALAKPGVCFQRAELYDVIHATSGAKIAGAAQKRNKHGLLFQGSVEKSALGPVDWNDFHDRFAAALAALLGTTSQPTAWPDLHEDEVTGLIEQYASAEWIEYR